MTSIMISPLYLRRLNRQFNLNPAEAAQMKKLADLFFNPKADEEFDMAIHQVKDGSPVSQALSEMANNPPRHFQVQVVMIQTWNQVRPILEEAARRLILIGITGTRYSGRLYWRTIAHEVGFTGNLTPMDAQSATNLNLNPLNRFEKWLVATLIKVERETRQEWWHQAMKD